MDILDELKNRRAEEASAKQAAEQAAEAAEEAEAARRKAEEPLRDEIERLQQIARKGSGHRFSKKEKDSFLWRKNFLEKPTDRLWKELANIPENWEALLRANPALRIELQEAYHSAWSAAYNQREKKGLLLAFLLSPLLSIASIALGINTHSFTTGLVGVLIAVVVFIIGIVKTPY